MRWIIFLTRINKKVECVVIGGGIIGVTIAYELLRQGRSVTLIDKDQPGKGCSYGNAGHFAAEQIFPMPSPSLIKTVPSMLLNPDSPLTLKASYFLSFIPWGLRFLWNCRRKAFDRGTCALKFLNKTALQDWTELLEDSNLQKHLTKKGTIEVFKTQKGRNSGLKSVPNFVKHDISVQILSAADLKEKIPSITDNQYGGLFFPHSGHSINPYGIVRDLHESFLKQGGKFLLEKVENIKIISAEQSEIIFKTGSLIAKNIFICSGYESRKIIKMLGYIVPMTAERGYHVMLEKPNIPLEYALTYHERKFIITPMEQGIRLAGTVEFSHADDKPNYHRARMLVKFSKEILPNISQEGSQEWMGSRPTLPDYLPILDKVDNVYFAFGHNHLGLTQAASTAKIMVKMMTDQTASFLHIQQGKNPFRLGRF